MRLTEGDVTSYKEAKDNFLSEKDKVERRIDEVLHVIFEAFEKKWSHHCSWWFADAEEGGMGSIPTDFESPWDKECGINFVSDCGSFNSLETDYWNYSTEFPRQFLFMDNKEIISQIHEEIRKTEKNREETKLKRQRAKEEKQKLKTIALEKLSKDEAKALGLRKTAKKSKSKKMKAAKKKTRKRKMTLL